jgi:hypothetical protein
LSKATVNYGKYPERRCSTVIGKSFQPQMDTDENTDEETEGKSAGVHISHGTVQPQPK